MLIPEPKNLLETFRWCSHLTNSPYTGPCGLRLQGPIYVQRGDALLSSALKSVTTEASNSLVVCNSDLPRINWAFEKPA